MEGFKQFREEKQKPIIRENAVENSVEIVKEKGLGRKNGYNFEEIKKLEEPIGNLVVQLEEGILGERYDAIIGDDASGRIPTLVIRKIIEDRIHKLHPDLTAEEQREALKTYFVTGAASVTYEQFKKVFPVGSILDNMKGPIDQSNADLLKYFKSIKPKIKKRALLITEYIATGDSITGLAKTLKKVGIPFDVASVIVKSQAYDKANKNISLSGGSLFMGGFGHALPDIYGQKHISGVVKKTSEFEKGSQKLDIHTKPFLKEISEKNETDFKYEDPSKDIAMAREDVSLMADRILEKVWGNQK